MQQPRKRPEPPKGPRPRCLKPCGVPVLDGGDVLRLHSLLTLLGLVGDLGALLEGLEPTAGYPGIVYEEVFAALVRGDKAVAFIGVEPLDCSLGHVL